MVHDPITQLQTQHARGQRAANKGPAERASRVRRHLPPTPPRIIATPPLPQPCATPTATAGTGTSRRRGRTLRHWPSPLSRIGPWVALAIFLGTVLPIGSAQPAAPKTPPTTPAARDDDNTPPAADTTPRRREGTTISGILGEFKSTGGRITFYPTDGSQPLHALENLALERIWRLQDVGQGRQWQVTGLITEFRDANYLLVTRALLKNG